MTIEVDIRKKCHHFTLTVQFQAGSERLGILGASGCGKSMTLRCIAGVLLPDSGIIRINGKTVFDSKRRINLPPQQRKAGLLFQHYALFPNMSVRDNLRIVIKDKPFSLRTELAEKMLQKMRLTRLADAKPAKLSGGEQQRAAMGRMLLSSPEMLMLDEPLSALDSYLHSAVETELTSVLQEFQKTKNGSVIFVSHHRDEIYRLCERIIVLQEGQITADGSRDDLFYRPGTVAAARLTGVKNIVPAAVISKEELWIPAWGLKLTTAHQLNSEITHIGIRAHHIQETEKETVNCFDCRTERIQSEPFRVHEHLFVSGGGTEHLVRFVSENTGWQVNSPPCSGVRRFFVSPEHVMPLRK
ncbi:MAG: ATP-binding cassette domain-containing protein [Planctomycetaceae bacterium]|jgi:molybdate transport system ATP-binding protein|nr:ATP-binding cassette domain-containing protein [Planctomycetaceae bacterium]